MRRAVVLTLVVLGFLVCVAGRADAAPTDGPEEAKCKNPADWGSVGGAIKGIGDKVGIPGTSDSTTVKLDTTAPKWFREEAKKEAEKESNCNLAMHVWVPDCKTMKAWEGDGNDDTKGYDDGVVPDACVGPYPSSAYNITYDEGGWTQFQRKIWGFSTGFIFNIGKTMVQIGMWGIRTAFSVNLKQYSDFVEPMAQRYQDNIVGPMGLNDLAWMVLMAFVAFKALTGKVGMAIGEFLFAMIMIGLATALSGNVTGYMNDLSDRLDEVSVALLNAASPEGEAAPTEITVGGQGDKAVPAAVDRLQAKLFEQFVEEPYTYINWGGPEVLKTKYCQDRVNYIKAAGLMDDGGWAWRFLGEDGECRKAVMFNKTPSTSRFVGALLTTIVSGTVMVLLLLLSLSMLMSKFLLMLLFAAWPLAAWGAALPGGMRRVSWSWVSMAAQTVIVYEGMALALSMTLIGSTTVLTVTAENGIARGSIAERYLFLIVVVVTFGLGVRKGVLAASKNVAERMNDNLTRLSPAAANWQDRNRGGMDFAAADRPVLHAAGAPARMAQVRMAERRNAKRSMKNLERMEQRREAPLTEVKSDVGPPSAGGGGGSGGGGGGRGGGGTRRDTTLRGQARRIRQAGRDAAQRVPRAPRPRAVPAHASRGQRFRINAMNRMANAGHQVSQANARGAAIGRTTARVGWERLRGHDRSGLSKTRGGTYTKFRNPRLSDWKSPSYAIGVRVRARMASVGHRRSTRRHERNWDRWT